MDFDSIDSVDLILPSEAEFLVWPIGRPLGHDGVSKALSVRIMNMEASPRKVIRVFLLAPLVYIPSAPSCVRMMNVEASF